MRDQAAARGRGLSAAVKTHTGRKRLNNEDSFVFQPRRGRFAVIDGMGGQAAGEVAAAITRAAIEQTDAPAKAFLIANRQIRERARRNPAERGMGCVATAAVVTERGLEICHVGDTRAYLATRTGVEQLTRDHTVVADRQEREGLTAEEARDLPDRHHVTRDIGGRDRRDTRWIDQADTEVRQGDILLLCSDGLHDLVSQDELFHTLSQARAEAWPPDSLVDHLVHLALRRGGDDDITVLIVRFESPFRTGRVAADAPGGRGGRSLLNRSLRGLVWVGIGLGVGLTVGFIVRVAGDRLDATRSVHPAASAQDTGAGEPAAPFLDTAARMCSPARLNALTGDSDAVDMCVDSPAEAWIETLGGPNR